jgi:hypothetical protein
MPWPKQSKTDDWLPRHKVVQPFLDCFDTPDYLEVGVARGLTFHAVTAARKTAVDPHFRFDVDKHAGPGIAYHEVTSDEYFGAIIEPSRRFDVIYLDGLHTFEQTLRDLMSAQLFLAERGVIVIDDVWPNSFAAACSTLEANQTLRRKLAIESPAWMGDVFRLLYFIDSFMQQFTCRIVCDNFGQAVLWRQARGAVTERRVLDVALTGYEDLLLGGAFDGEPLADILADYKRTFALS